MLECEYITGRLGVGGSNPLAPTIFPKHLSGGLGVGVEPAGAGDACAAIGRGRLLRWPENQNADNNPMHSSEAIDGVMFFRSDLTRRAKQGHNVIMTSVWVGSCIGLLCSAPSR